MANSNTVKVTVAVEAALGGEDGVPDVEVEGGVPGGPVAVSVLAVAVPLV